MSDPYIVADVIRAISVPVAVVCAAASLAVAHRGDYRSLPQLCRFLGLAFFCLAVTMGEYHFLGDKPYWPVLLANSFGLGLSLGGTLPLVLSKTEGQRASRI